MINTFPSKACQIGSTLTETLVVIAIIGILASQAVPAYSGMLERNRLQRVAESFKSDQQFARAEALKRGQNVVITQMAGTDGDWCYGLAFKTAKKSQCDCHSSDSNADDFCDIKRIQGNEFGETTLENSVRHTNTFDFRRGTSNADGATFTTTQYTVRVVFSDVGRVRLCIPKSSMAGKEPLPGVQTNC